ncbi:hypothetical protein BDW59DRAFT_163669 [Aspergillus cavernicola]|uniref:Uncharacterized protein n=1 Tax=Aspergillus cavernicola TaxID=176166 RepID=A0ABR4I6T9_9EURO
MQLDPWKLVVLAVATAVVVGRSQAQTESNQVNASIFNWGQARVNTIRDTVYLDGGSLWWRLGYDNGTVRLGSYFDIDESLVYYLNLSSSSNTATTNLTSLFGRIPNA